MDLYEIQVDHGTPGNKNSENSYGHDPQTEQRRGIMQLWDDHCAKPTPAPKADKVITHISSKRRSA
jgi:hypothetical protein